MYRFLVFTIFALLFFSIGCEKKEDVTILPGECALQSDCAELEDCKFTSLTSEKGECVPMIECSETDFCSDGRACRAKEDKSYCGYSSEVFSITTESNLNATKDVYFEKYLSVEGDSGNHFFVLNQGSSLPSGLSLESNGKLSGTPLEKINSFSFSIVAVNGKITDIYYYNTRAVEKNFLITIIENPNCGECPENSYCDTSLEVPTCVCNQSFHFEDGICLSNTKTVSCLDTPPLNATSEIIDVEIIWDENDSQWQSPAICDWSCNETFEEIDGACVCSENFHEENGVCKSNTKSVQCKNLSPENSEVDIIEVEIYWDSTNLTWSEPEECAWGCIPDFHVEINRGENYLCVSDVKVVACIEEDTIPEHASSIIGNVEIYWNSDTETWDEPEFCYWECDTGFENSDGICRCPYDQHIENGVCVDSVQLVSCIADPEGIDNGFYIIENVEIYWSEESGVWDDTPECEWECNEWFMKNDEQTLCISKLIINETTRVDGNMIEIYNRSEDELDLSQLYYDVWIEGDVTYQDRQPIIDMLPETNYIAPNSYLSFSIAPSDRVLNASIIFSNDDIHDPEAEIVFLDGVVIPSYSESIFESYGRFPDITGEFKPLEVWTPERKNEVIIDVCGTGYSSSQLGLNEEVTFDGFYLVDGLTTSPRAEVEMISSQFCIAIDDTNISDFECFDASFDSVSGYNHYYNINYTANELGMFNFFFRFSGDGGLSWFPCSTSPGTFYQNGESFNEQMIGFFGVIE
ncbi:hypothetical protein JXR93_12960 [bacterium]|nr:hypothetical protein [bacterium]